MFHQIMRFISKSHFKVFLILALTFFYCEYLIYYLVIYQCSWPSLEEEGDNSTIKSMFLADTHLLGPYRGHWFDKLRREWQMYRSFQSAVSIYEPEVVFILGDLFDEGQWCSDKEFQEYINRFFSLFEVPKNIQLYVVPGNHDSVNIKGTYFILLNSMAMEGDGCYLCYDAEQELRKIAGQLKGLKDGTCKNEKKLTKYSRPIILQHFPMYRKSDANCNETDEAPHHLKNQLFKEKWDCLSKEASEMIYNELNPRAIFTGHVHHGCHTIHRGDIHEYTLPSFSWRNKNNPTFMLAKISPHKYSIRKCDLPRESTVIFIYSSVGLTIFTWAIYILQKSCSSTRKSM